MKIYLSLLILLLSTGCDKKPKPPIVENNQTVIEEVNETKIVEEVVEIEEVKEEPTLGRYDWRANDELITETPASKIVVIKSKRVLVLFDENENVLSRHRISLGKNSVGTKLKQGDYKTPEGTYQVIDMRNDKVYYKEILISYPNQEDRVRSKGLGFKTGGGITIHAQPNWNWDGHGNDFTLGEDWTEGCMAVTNEGMDMLFSMIQLGTPIEIRE
jgi:murein L,D-transpeptidase YafK